jgi:hypothetical protein
MIEIAKQMEFNVWEALSKALQQKKKSFAKNRVSCILSIVLNRRVKSQ